MVHNSQLFANSSDVYINIGTEGHKTMGKNGNQEFNFFGSLTMPKALIN